LRNEDRPLVVARPAMGRRHQEAQIKVAVAAVEARHGDMAPHVVAHLLTQAAGLGVMGYRGEGNLPDVRIQANVSYARRQLAARD